MAKAVTQLNVGAEILEGLRELRGGHVGRVITLPAVATIRERTGLSQSKFASLRTRAFFWLAAMAARQLPSIVRSNWQRSHALRIR